MRPARRARRHRFAAVFDQHAFRLYWVAIGLFIFLFAWLVVIVLTPPATLIAVTADTETLNLVSLASEGASIVLPAATLTTDTSGESNCVHGTLSPARGSQMTFTRQDGGPLIIRLEPSKTDGRAGVIEGADQDRRTLRESVTINLQPSGIGCTPDDAVNQAALQRIPIMGALTLGSEFSAQTGLNAPLPAILKSGHVETFTRAIDHIWKIPLAGVRGTVYPTGAVDLPPGSQLRECARPQDRMGWFGYVEVGPKGEGAAGADMQVIAYTEARRLALISPGGEKTGGVACEGGGAAASGDPAQREDVLGVSNLARTVQDPLIGFITVLLTALALIMPTMVGLHTLSVTKESLTAAEPPRDE